MDVDVERRLALSEDEDEDDLMDLMPASLGQLMGSSPGGEEFSRLDKLLLAHSLKAKPHCALKKYTRRCKGPLATRRKPITKLKIPVPSWGKENQNAQVLGRQQEEVRSKPPRPRLSALHAETRRKTRVKLDIKVPNWDNEELIVEEEQVNASFVSSQETKTSYEASLPSISPAFRDEGLISEYNAARSMFLKTPEFSFQGNSLDPTPPPLEALKKMVDSPERISCLEAECVSGLEAEMSTVEPERDPETERRFQPVQHLQPERQQQDLEAEVSAVHEPEPEPEPEVEHQFQPEQQPEVSAVHDSALAVVEHQFQPEKQPELSAVQEPEPEVNHQLQPEQPPEVSADQGPEDEQQFVAEPEVDQEPQPGQQPEPQHRQQQQPEAQPVLDAGASNTFSGTPEKASPVSEQQPAKKRKPRAKRRSREAQASPTLDGGTKWVDGQRRSTRFKSRPLETWRGERLLYARVHSTMMTLIGVKHSSPLPPWPKRGQQKYNYKVDSLVSEEHEAKLKLAAYG